MTYRDLNLTHAYVGYRPCGHAIYLGVDDGSKELAKDLAKLVRDGCTIERKTIEDARATPIAYCDCVKVDPIKGRLSRKPDRRQVERRADKRRLDDKSKARLKR